MATASLELGIDIGEVDLVCQLGSPRSIASFLQRVGRSGHAVDGTPKGRLFPLSRDDLVECAALLDSVRRGELDRLVIPEQPLDVLAQQIVAELAAREWNADQLLCSGPSRLALSCAGARGIRGRGRHAGGGFQHPSRPAWRADPSRRRQPYAARPAARPADRHDLGRHDPRHRRLPGDAGAREPAHRHRERGLCGREHGRRRLSAGQQLLSRPAPRAGHRPGRGRARRRRPTFLLAGRGAGPQRRPLACGVATAGGDRCAARHRTGRGIRAALARGRGRHRPGGRSPARRLSGRGPWGAGLPADPGDDRARAFLRRGRRHAARDPLAPWQPDQPRLGAGAAQALLPQVQLRAPGGGD